MDNKFNYIISGVIAIGMYILLILIFISYLKSPNVKTYKAISNDTIIQLDIISVKDNIKNKNIETKQKKVPKVKIEKSSSVSANKKTNLKSLFAKVSTKASKVKEKSAINIKNNDSSSRFKSKINKNKANNKIKISKLDNTDIKEVNKKVNLTNNKGDFDEYYSKINTIILNRWYQYPLLTMESYLVKVEIQITNQGQFSYNIITYSNNLNIDNAIKEFLTTQIKEIYPLPIDGKSKRILINFFNNKKDL